MINKLDRLWIIAILFMNGWYFALPVTDIALPKIFTPIQVVHGVFLHEFLLFAYIGFQFIIRKGHLPIGHRAVRSFAILVATLGCLGIISTGINFQPIKELAGACRYFLFAIYFLLAVRWGGKHGPVFVLQHLLLGIASAGIVNLYFTFATAFKELGGLPLLLGQNGPGGYLGMSVILSAWLMLERKTTIQTVIAVISGMVGVFAASISYSKLSMLMAGLGVFAWAIVFLSMLVSRRSRKLSAVVLVMLIAVVIVKREQLSLYVQAVDTFITYKFRNLDERAVGERSQYLAITAEIVARHPVFGVGYGGFYKAALATNTYQNSQSAEEDPEAGERGESNPHNSFLYYTSANGLPGLTVAISLFVVLLRVIWHALAARGLHGNLVWACLAGGYFIFAMTLPTLFNTSIIYIPAAVAVALMRQSRSRQLKLSKHIALPKYATQTTISECKG